jgi:hypothetical protein
MLRVTTQLDRESFVTGYESLIYGRLKMLKHRAFTRNIFISLTVAVSISFGMAFKNRENSALNLSAVKNNAALPFYNGDLKGTWFYAAIISSDGKVRKLNNRESNFIVRADGTYENNFGVSPNWSQTVGKYSLKGSRLTLIRSDGDEKIYDMTFDDGKTLTLKAPNGSGYVLEKQ